MAIDVRVLSKLPTGDAVIDRWQDHVISTLNPLLRRWPGDGGTTDLTDLTNRISQLESRVTVLSNEISQLTPTTNPVLITAFYPGKPGASALMMAFLATVPVTILANLSGSRLKVGTSPAATAVLSVQKNGTQVGTITIDTGGNAAFSSSAISLSTSDELTVVAPASADAFLSDVRFTIAGSR